MQKTPKLKTPKAKNQIRPADVFKAVAEIYEVPKSTLINGNHKHLGNRPIIHRQLVIWVLRTDLNMQLDNIAKLMHRSRTTVIRALDNTQRRLNTNDPRYVHGLKAVKQRLNSEGFWGE